MEKELREKFKKLYRDKFNIDLTDEEATEMSADLINLMSILLKPEKQVQTYETYQQQRYI